jgi:hypothetical protein
VGNQERHILFLFRVRRSIEPVNTRSAMHLHQRLVRFVVRTHGACCNPPKKSPSPSRESRWPRRSGEPWHSRGLDCGVLHIRGIEARAAPVDDPELIQSVDDHVARCEILMDKDVFAQRLKGEIGTCLVASGLTAYKPPVQVPSESNWRGMFHRPI